MNKDDASQYLPLVQALADGKTIQHNDSVNWIDVLDPVFISSPSNYRIKPEPREWEIVVATEKNRTYKAGTIDGLASDDLQKGELPTGPWKVVKVREILD